MIQFIKEVYLTAFAIIFRRARVKDIAYKAGSAVGAITVIEWLILVGISGYVEMFYGKKYLLSKPAVVIAFLALFLVNGYVLFFRGHGVKFARDFDGLEKTRRITLVVSCAVVTVAAIVFFICSAIAHQRFVGAR